MSRSRAPLSVDEYRPRATSRPKGALARMENLSFLEAFSGGSLPAQLAGLGRRVRLAYLDPPFMTGRARTKPFVAPAAWRRAGLPERLGGVEVYADRWRSLDDYLSFLEARLVLLREMLSPDGSVYLHLDQRVSHYAKTMMDRLFGRGNFRNEIIWRYVSGGVAKGHFARKHDTILFYTRSKDYVFHPQKERKPTRAGSGALHGRDAKGEYVWYIRPGTNPKVPKGVKKYLDGYISDVWYIPMVNPQANERREAGLFPTQKPLALLERVVRASSDPGDVVADLFCGSGTTAVAASSLDRRFLCVDASREAVNVSLERVLRAGSAVRLCSPRAPGSAEPPEVKVGAEGGERVLEVRALDPEVPAALVDAFDEAKRRLKRPEFTASLVRLVSVGGRRRGGGYRGVARVFCPQTGPAADRSAGTSTGTGYPAVPLGRGAGGKSVEARVLDIFGGWHRRDRFEICP